MSDEKKDTPADTVEGRRKYAVSMIERLGKAAEALLAVRENFETMRDQGDRSFTDDQKVAMMRRAWEAATALAPFATYLNDLREMAYDLATRQDDLGRRIREVTGIKPVEVTVEVVNVTLCGPDGHHPSCPGHPDHPQHHAWVKSNPKSAAADQGRQAGFRPAKKGEA